MRRLNPVLLEKTDPQRAEIHVYQGPSCGRERDLDLLHAPCGVRESLLNVIDLQVRVCLKDLGVGVARGHQPDNRRNRHPHAANAGFSIVGLRRSSETRRFFPLESDSLTARQRSRPPPATAPPPMRPPPAAARP